MTFFSLKSETAPVISCIWQQTFFICTELKGRAPWYTLRKHVNMVWMGAWKCASQTWCRIKNDFLTGDFLYKNEVSDNFPRKIHHNKFYFCTCSMHDSFIGISPWKKMKMMFYTSDKLTNVLECVMFVSQFHVHCKIGTLIHLITFDSTSNANLCQMIAKTTRKLSRVFYCSLSTRDYFYKDYVNKPVACINAIFNHFVVSYYGYSKK